MFRNNELLASLNQDLYGAQRILDTLEQLAIAKQHKTLVVNKIKKLASLPLDPTIIVSPSANYIYPVNTIPFGFYDVSVGSSIKVLANYYNASNSYITVTQDGIDLGVIPPYSISKLRGTRGLDLFISQIMVDVPPITYSN